MYENIPGTRRMESVPDDPNLFPDQAYDQKEMRDCWYAGSLFRLQARIDRALVVLPAPQHNMSPWAKQIIEARRILRGGDAPK